MVKRTKGDNAIVLAAIAIVKKETASGAKCWSNGGAEMDGLAPLLTALRLEYASSDRESSGAIFLDHMGRMLGCERIAEGTSSSTPIYMRDLVKAALNYGANGLILWHTHPGGDCRPSPEDVKGTHDVLEYVLRLDLIVHDHFVISSKGACSIRHFVATKNIEVIS